MPMFNTNIQEIYTLFDEEYQAARKGIGIVNRSDSGFLFLTGKDVLDLLNRISTSELLSLQQNETRSTILVTEKGKIVDVVTLITYDNGYLMEIAPKNEDKISNWIEKFIITEEIKINILSHNFLKYSLIGPKVSILLEQLGLSISKLAKQNLWKIFINGIEVMIFHDPLFSHDVWNLYLPKMSVNEVISQLIYSSGLSVNQVGRRAFECIRIEEGVPAFGTELTEQVNPLEAGLQELVSFTKGCYLGQEVIARLNTYDKLQRKLTGFTGMVGGLERSAIIFQNSKGVGWTTSYCYSPILNQYLALGYLKTNISPEGLFLRSKNNGEYPVKVVELPLRI